MQFLASLIVCVLVAQQSGREPTSVEDLLRAGQLERAVEAAQQRYQAEPDNPEVRIEFIRLHMALAAHLMREQQYPAAERVLAAVLRVEPKHAEAKRLGQSIAEARAAAPGKIAEARRWLRLEWNEAAYEVLDQACALLPDRRREWVDDLLKAVEGAGDDHYFCKNFHQAFFYYDAMQRSGRPVTASLTERWMQSLVLSLSEDIERVRYPEKYWEHVVTDAEKRMGSRGDLLMAILRGLANENLVDLDRAASNYAEATGEPVTQRDEAGIRAARAAALSIARRRYDAGLSPRRTGPWARTDSGDWRTVDSAHFRVQHHNSEVGRRVSEALEEHFSRVAAFLGRRPEQVPWLVMCNVYVHKDVAALRQAVKRGGEVRGLSIMTLAGGKLHAQTIHVTQNDPLLLAVTLPHEIMHLMLGAVTNHRPIPAVLDEGMALHVETRCRAAQFRRVLSRESGPRSVRTLLAVRDVHPSGESRFYSEAFRLVDVLLGRGTAAQVLEAATEPDPAAALVRQFRFADLAECDRALRGAAASQPAAERRNAEAPVIPSGEGRNAQRSINR